MVFLRSELQQQGSYKKNRHSVETKLIDFSLFFFLANGFEFLKVTVILCELVVVYFYLS